MTSAEFPKEEIAGIGFISGGTYGSIDVAGVGTGKGTTVVNGEMEVAGMYRHTGRLTVNDLEVAGTVRVRGDLECGEADVAGFCRVTGFMRAERLEVAGRLHVGGDLRGTNVEVGGRLRVDREVALETLHVGNGSIRVAGLLSAELIRLRLRRTSTAASIGGGVVVVRRGRLPDWRGYLWGGAHWEWDEDWDEEWADGFGFGRGGEAADKGADGRPDRLDDAHVRASSRSDGDSGNDAGGDRARDGGHGPSSFDGGRRTFFRTEEIEADRVDVVGTRARAIRADRVVLGAGCDVGLVEARELTRHSSARVGRFVKR